MTSTRNTYLTWLVVAAGALINGATFMADLDLPVGVAAGIPHILPAALMFMTGSRRLIAGFSLLGVVLIGVGWIYSPAGEYSHVVALNRVSTMFAVAFVGGCSWMVLHHSERQFEMMSELLEKDSLTALLNRRGLAISGRAMIAECREQSAPLAALAIDIDHFKSVNDQHGHIAGDGVILHIADSLRTLLGDDSLLARVGGDEFVVLRKLQPDETARAIADTVCRYIEDNPFPSPEGEVPVSVSVGAVVYDGDYPPNEIAATADADVALYRAKRAGRARVSVRSTDTASVATI